MTEYRFICPECDARYGRAAADGFIDIERCDVCKARGNPRRLDKCSRTGSYRATDRRGTWRPKPVASL